MDVLIKAAELAAFGLSVKRAKVLELINPATLLIRAGVGCFLLLQHRNNVVFL
jgi:hypothetical protein